MGDEVALEAAGVVVVAFLQALAGGEPGGPDPALTAVAVSCRDFSLQAGDQELLVGPGLGPGPFVAVVSVVLAVVAVAYAIYRLSFVLAPVETGLLYIENEAAKPHSPLVGMAAADRGLRANYADLNDFLDGYDQLRVAEYEAETAVRIAQARAAQPTDDEALRKQHSAAVAAGRHALDNAHLRVIELRPRMIDLVQLAGYLNVRSRFDDERRKVLIAALVAALGIVRARVSLASPSSRCRADPGRSFPEAGQLHRR
jgi:hypothetical protein